jgi:TRAP-type C4-dicarboxylate transport system permease small subunit
MRDDAHIPLLHHRVGASRLKPIDTEGRLMSKISHIFEKITVVLVACLLMVLTFNVFFQVLSRHLIKIPMVWTEEIARFSFIWCAFLGASLAVKNKAHFAVELLTKRFLSLRKAFAVFVSFCIMTVAGVFLIQGVRYSIMGLERISPTVNIKMIWIYASIPVSACLMLFYVVEQLIDELKTPEVKEQRIS